MSKQKTKQHHPSQTPPTPHADGGEAIVVPRGQSRLRFFFNLLLVIFLLAIFSVTGPMMSALSGGPAGDDIQMTWVRPDKTERSMTVKDFWAAKRAFDRLAGYGLASAPQLGLFEPSEDDFMARLLVIEDLAIAAGIHVGDDQLRSVVKQITTLENFQALAQQQRGISAVAFQENFRRMVRIWLYLNELELASSGVDPNAVEAAWREANQEYAFNYIVKAVEDYRVEVEPLIPELEELQDWFNARPPAAKNQYMTGPSWSAEWGIIDLPLQAGAADKLLAAFPLSEGEDLETLAKTYYDFNYFYRFKKPEEEVGEDQVLYLPYEEVKELCYVEALAYNSLRAWVTEAQTRILAGEEVDFVAELERLGLRYEKDAVPHTLEGWREVELPWLDDFVISDMARAGAGELSGKVSITANAYIVSRVIEKLPPSMPPFDEIRERVAEAWVTDSLSNRARLKLESVRDVLGSRPSDPTEEFLVQADGSRFSTAAQGLGFDVQYWDYSTRQDLRTAGPLESEETTAVREYLQRMPGFGRLREGEVPAAQVSARGTHAILVHDAGSRDPSIEKLTPSDLLRFRRQLGNEDQTAFYDRTLRSMEWFEDMYQLDIVVPQPPEEEPEPDTEGAGEPGAEEPGAGEAAGPPVGPPAKTGE